MGKEVQFDVVNVDDGGQIMTILWVPNESPDGAAGVTKEVMEFWSEEVEISSNVYIWKGKN